ncbi:MAG: hypothetical protein AAF928_20295 [Myxococcota bacterium]
MIRGSKSLRAGGATAVLAMVTALAWASRATPPAADRAEPVHREIFVAATPSGSALLPRLRAELRTLGYAVRGSSIGLPRDVAKAAREVDAAAVLIVRGGAEGIDVWAVDAEGMRVGRRVEVRPQPTDPPDGRDALLALRAVEVLRARLLEVPSAPAPAPTPSSSSAAPRASPPAEVAAPAAPPPVVAIAVGPAVGLSPGGVGPVGHLHLAVAGRPHPRLALEAFATTPLFPTVVAGPEGQADVSVGHLGGSVAARATASGPVDLRLGAGVAVTWLRVEGSAAPPFAATDENTFVAWPFVAVHAAYVPPPLGVFLDVRLGPVAPEPVVRFAEREVVRWGRPAVVAAAGTEIAF